MCSREAIKCINCTDWIYSRLRSDHKATRAPPDAVRPIPRALHYHVFMLVEIGHLDTDCMLKTAVNGVYVTRIYLRPCLGFESGLHRQEEQKNCRQEAYDNKCRSSCLQSSFVIGSLFAQSTAIFFHLEELILSLLHPLSADGAIRRSTLCNVNNIHGEVRWVNRGLLVETLCTLSRNTLR